MNLARMRGAASRLAAAVTAVAVMAAVGATAPQAADVPATPAGTTALALDGKVSLAWKAAADADGYAVYRGTSPAAVTTKISPAQLTATTFEDTTAVNGVTYFYAVRAEAQEGESPSSQIARATPRAASCSTGNAVVRENCFPGTTAWKTTDNSPAYPDGIEGFTSAPSVDAGDSVQVRVESAADVTYRVDIYRTGWYGGDQGRLIGSIENLVGDQPQGCEGSGGFDPAGLVDCSAWPVSFTLQTSADWPSGAYLLKLVRSDNGKHSDVLLVVRNDGSSSDVLYHVPTNTYLAYNNWFGKSLYTSQSDGPATVTGANRAAKVSYDRPFSQATSGPQAHDWFTRTDVATIGWLERQGYDTTYVDSTAFDADGAQLQDHHVFVSGAHDEYWTQAMRDAAQQARDAGTSLFFMGANAMYWRVRFEPSALSGEPRRVMVAYKTIEGGPVDPSGTSTSTFRDPAGPNQPENALLGLAYIGDNSAQAFPLRVSAAQGKSRVWRYTSLAGQAAGTSTNVGSQLVGWEWDALFQNGLTPAGTETIAASPVEGNLVQNNGSAYTFGPATQQSTIYKAASGATVFATGTNNWFRGLARNVDGDGEPNLRIQQATANVLADMGAHPSTPAPDLAADVPGAPEVDSTTPAHGSGGASLTGDVKVTFDRELDPATIDAGDVTLQEFGGGTVPGTLSWDPTTDTLTLDPSETLEPFTGYTVTVGTGIKSWSGDALASPFTFTFTAGAGTPPAIVARTPGVSATAVPSDTTITARFDRRLDAGSVTNATFSVSRTADGTVVPATVAYDNATRTITLTPTARLQESTGYTVTATTGIIANGDGTPMAAEVTWAFTTNQNLKVTHTWPAANATGISSLAAMRATFSRAIDTLPANAFTLRTSGGTPVPATISYDATDRTATLVPDAALDTGASYQVELAGVHAADGAPLDTATWTFTTASTPPPAAQLTGTYPAAAAVGVSPGTTVRASFDIPIDAGTVTGQNVTLTPDGGVPVAASVNYDAGERKIILTPLAALAPGTHYTAALTTGVRTTAGEPLPVTQTWTFTTANCPCNLITNQQPEWNGPVQDFRPGSGPFSYELGQKIQVTGSSQLIALRFWKHATETGTHVGRVWNSAGAQIASVTFQNESASGWQRQALAVPLTLQTGQTYTISVGMHNTYVRTYQGLASQLTSGPLRSVADGHNGVYASAAGQFPTQDYQSSNYFVDGVVRLPSVPTSAPAVASQTPLNGATGVPVDANVTATFAGRLDASTVRASSVTLTDAGGHAVPATVSYDDETKTVTLDPSGSLDKGVAYTARLSTAIRSEDETALPAAVTWTFTTVPPTPPVVTQTSPVPDAIDLSATTDVTATFDQSMAPASLTSSTFVLRDPDGTAVPAAVDYDALTRTATLHPTAPLQPATEYTAELTSGATGATGLGLVAHSWSFTTSHCPCSLFDNVPLMPQYTGLSTDNGRPHEGGPWTLEMGVKVQVAQPAQLTAVRFFKDAAETGTHTARVWTADGTLLGSVAFGPETESGWQQADLPTPLPLTPGQPYTVSVGMNDTFTMSTYAFLSARVDGPLSSVADGQNGVYGDAAGAFPTQHWGSSNYGIDAVVE